MKKLTLSLLAILATCAGSALAGIDAKAAAAKIDALVQAKLQKEKLQPLGPISDEVFVRRVYLDVVGRIPTLDETTQFLADSSTEKRAALIDKLLKSDGYTQNMFNYWADILRYKSQMVGGGQSAAAGFAYAGWLRDALKNNMPYDQMVRELVAASGKTYENGAVGFYIRDYNMPLDNMAVTTQVFLGTSMVCAQCHNHPFDKWSQMDYYQMAAHTYGMTATNGLSNPMLSNAIYGDNYGRNKTKKGKGSAPKLDLPDGMVKADVTRAMTEILRPLRYNTVLDSTDKKVLRLPHDYQYSNAKPKDAIEPVIPASFSKEGTAITEDNNAVNAYAKWMTSKENPRFTTVIANRLWKKLMGQALIEPLDEMTDSSVPSNPQLMTFLEETMKGANYDMRAYLRSILNSSTYQQAAYAKDVEPGEVYHFPGPLLRRMSAEQIWDSMVTLHKPNPDEPSMEAAITAEASLRRIEWMDRALNGLSPDELKACSIKVAQKQKELAAEVRAAQEKLAAANKAKDEDAVRAAQRAVKSQRARIDEAVDEIVYDAAFQKFRSMVKEGRIKEFCDDADFVREVSAAVKAKKGDKDVSMDEAVAIFSATRRAKYKQEVKQRTQEDSRRFAISKDNDKARQGLMVWENRRDTYFIRAVDLRHPAPNGHFLREFGQSDRELTENANDEASVSQALTLLNGVVFTQLMSPYSVISQNMAKARQENAEGVIDAVYLSLLSRKATAEERAILKEVADNADATDRGDVLWTVLNTRQFFFIQ